MARTSEDRATQPTPEHDTRHRILLHVLRHGPVSASDISEAFGLSAAGVRRHLDNIVSDLSLIHISEPTRRHHVSRMPSSA